MGEDEESKYSILEMVTTNEDTMKGTSDTQCLHKLAWRNVCYKTKDRAILQDCWGEVTESSLTCIMGPSGAGKSTLLNILAGRAAQVNNGKYDTLTGQVRGLELT